MAVKLAATAKKVAKKIAAKPKATKKPSAKDKWLQKDVTYKEQRSVADAAFKRFNAGQKINLDQFNIKHKRGLQDNSRNKTSALRDVNEGFAARGMASSGVFQQARDDTNDQFARQRSAMLQNLADFKQDQAYEKTNASAQKNEAIKRALRDATERYAQQQYLI